ncbi:hypothetical protein Tco_0839129 [Tanacetum coccineum]|uniref:Uncharacterized protein n=1 Tax=Tanacetum coccineum TaxID=301880 RepID=A0ABQ5ASA3_9ASTR
MMRKRQLFSRFIKSHKRAIAWKLSVIKGSRPGMLYSQNSMEEDRTPLCNVRKCKPQNPRCIKKEVEKKLLKLDCFTPSSDMPLGKPVHWKTNEATRKDHFHSPFLDIMLERLAGNQLLCFLDGLLGLFSDPLTHKIKKRQPLLALTRNFRLSCHAFGLLQCISGSRSISM